MTLIIYAIFGLIALALLASFAMPIAWLRGKSRVAILGAVLAAWAYLYWDNIQKPEDFTKWRVAAYQQCDFELAKLPRSISVDGFLDEGAALRKDSLLKLFSERRLGFLEVKVRPSPEGEARVAYPDGDQEGMWAVPGVTAPYARLELGQKGDASCAELPLGVSGRVDRPPFLPDTCITLKSLEVPTARYALTLTPSAAPEPTHYGAWSFIDRESGEVLARLTTVDTLRSISSGRISPKGTGTTKADCRSPHSVIVDLLEHSAAKSDVDRTSQLLASDRVAANIDVTKIDTFVGEIAVVEAAIERSPRAQHNLSERLHPDIHLEAWESAVDEAKRFGSGTYGPRLLMWNERKLRTLALIENVGSFKWHPFAAVNGFLVVKNNDDWYGRTDNFVVRFSNDGHIVWAVRISTPSSETRKCRRFAPEAVYLTSTHLMLENACALIGAEAPNSFGPTELSEVWKVPLSALPGPLSRN